MNLERLTKRGREIVARVNGIVDQTPIGVFLRECAYERRLRNLDPGLRRFDRVVLGTAISSVVTGVGLEYFCGPNAGALPLNLALLLSGTTFLEQVGFSRP